ncbi:hypothetical protein [Roseicitreum antarcticum]|uniref:hypothetical protein n=1 Tax=Roseicitreum antarcticum TaxID=564137 RepID=UPI000B8593C0|nr:hypothetical protein [Roseicitreum antarcticum]
MRQIIERLREQELTVLDMSQKLEHVFRRADSVVVMHHGQVAAHLRKDDVTRQEIVGCIMGTRMNT